VRLKCQVRVESVIAERDRKTYGEKHGQKESDLEPVEPNAPDVSGNRGQRQQEGADEEETRWPVYFIEGDAVEHSRYNSGAVDVSGNRGWALRQALKCLHSVLLHPFVSCDQVLPTIAAAKRRVRTVNFIIVNVEIRCRNVFGCPIRFDSGSNLNQ
jgi:hypothetical protein